MSNKIEKKELSIDDMYEQLIQDEIENAKRQRWMFDKFVTTEKNAKQRLYYRLQEKMWIANKEFLELELERNRHRCIF